jgi:glucokinase
MATLIGIDVGGTNLRIGVVAFDKTYDTNTQNRPRLIDEIRFQADFSKLCKTYQDSPQAAWRAILNVIEKDVKTVLAKYPEVRSIGIGFPGFIDPITHKIMQSPNLPGLHDVDLSHDLSALIGLPVSTENDALAATYGEHAHRSLITHHLLYLGLGTGVGGGLILNGKPWQGAHGVAMEAGHIIIEPGGRRCGCGNQGCMEQYASASGVVQSYALATQQNLTAHEIAIRAKACDMAAMNAYKQAGSSLAIALAHMLKVIDVRDIVIGGGLCAAWDLMQTAFNAQLHQDLIPALRDQLNITISSMGDQAGVIGAAMLAHQNT